MEKQKKKFLTEERILYLGGFIILSAAAIISFLVEAEHRTIIPKPEIVIPIINTICALGALVQFLFAKNHIIPYAIMLLQSVSTILTGYETLGVFLFTAMIILMFCNKDLRTHFYAKFIPLLSILLITLLGLIPFGWFRFVLAFIEAVFFLSFYFCIYKKLETLLISIAPVFNSVQEPKVSLPEAGGTIMLSELGLNERQQKFIFDNLTSDASYAELSEKYYVSTSTVKKEMADAFRKIGVKNLEELRLLLLQYHIKL